jgi:hypothetical protein
MCLQRLVYGQSMTEDEITRKRMQYRPRRIKVLFVGEAPPANGSFFYFGNNRLLHHMRRAIGSSASDADFLESFMERGWYLDDLISVPIRNMRDRKKQCRQARASLAARIVDYNPSAIVCLLRRIRNDVKIAASRANTKAHLYILPFAGQSHQSKFLEEMKRILPELEALPPT